MFRKLSYICFFVLLQSTSCFANSDSLTCAVISKNVIGIETEKDYMNLKYSADQFLSQRKDLRIIDRSKVDKILQEQAFQQSDWSDSNKSAEIGHALNANILIFVEYYRDFFVVNFLDVNTFEKTTKYGDNLKELKKLKGLKINDHSRKSSFIYNLFFHKIRSLTIILGLLILGWVLTLGISISDIGDYNYHDPLCYSILSASPPSILFTILLLLNIYISSISTLLFLTSLLLLSTNLILSIVCFLSD